jgi:hypothetical protein
MAEARPYQARQDLSRSRMRRIRVGQSGSSALRNWHGMRRTWAWSGPESELPSQNGPATEQKAASLTRSRGEQGVAVKPQTRRIRLEPVANAEPEPPDCGGPCPSRTEREPSVPVLDGQGP